MEVAEGDPKLHCLLFYKPYVKFYLIRGGTHRTGSQEFETRQRRVVRSPIFVDRHNLEMVAAFSRDHYCHYGSVPAF